MQNNSRYDIVDLRVRNQGSFSKKYLVASHISFATFARVHQNLEDKKR